MWGELVTGANWQWGELTVNLGISSGPAKSRNPHAKKRNPTPATKSTTLQHPQKLIIEIHQRWTVNHVF